MISAFFIEYHQSQTPQIIWKFNENLIEDQGNFIWSIISVPVLLSSSSIFSPSISIHSLFQNYFTYSNYILIPDIEARGFSRFTCLVFASQFSFSLENLNQTKITNLISKIENNSKNKFIIELQYRWNLLLKSLEKYSDDGVLLKLHEKMIQIFYDLHININEVEIE
jgi:hypothetical protein